MGGIKDEMTSNSLKLGVTQGRLPLSMDWEEDQFSVMMIYVTSRILPSSYFSACPPCCNYPALLGLWPISPLPLSLLT